MIKKLLSVVGIAVLAISLIVVITNPVVPSKYFIEGMAKQVDKTKSSLEETVTVRFELSGKGGGIYNLRADKTKVEVTEGDIDDVDLIMFMKATEFNSLMINMATGKADEFTIQSLVVGNFMDMAGDMFALGKLMGVEPPGE